MPCTKDQVNKLIEIFIRSRDFQFPHYHFPNTPNCRTGLVSLIRTISDTEFNDENRNRFTILTWISPSIKKGFLEESESEHKTVFYVERVRSNTFVILSLDSIEAPTTRRLIQVVREDLSPIAPEVQLFGWNSTPIRQRSLYGCGAYSLDDLLRCHQFPNLLKEIEKLPKLECGLDIKVTLPPEFMVSTQSFTTLSEYLDTIKDIYPPTHEKVAALYAAVHNSTIVSSDGKGFNKYIETANERFHRLSENTLPVLPPNLSFNLDRV